METGEFTRLLAAARQGGGDAVDRLLPLVYDELRGVAHRQLRMRRPGQTLETTALVNEAYLKLVDASQAHYEDRNHFFSVAAVAMRHILVDHARRRSAQKRGGPDEPLLLDEARLAAGPEDGASQKAIEILALDEALGTLARLDPRLVKLVELRFFGGLSVSETAEVLAVSERTVKRDWRKAKAFLYRALSSER